MQSLYSTDSFNFEKVLEPDYLTIEDCVNYSKFWNTLNFKDMPGEREQGKHEIKAEVLNLQHYHKGTVVKWCFPFRVIDKKRSFLDLSKVSDTISWTNTKIEMFNKTHDPNPENFEPELLYSSSLLVGDNFMQLANSNIVNRIHGGIVDCELFDFFDDPTPQYHYQNLLLVIQRDGTLFSVMPQLYAYPLKETDLKKVNIKTKHAKKAHNTGSSDTSHTISTNSNSRNNAHDYITDQIDITNLLNNNNVNYNDILTHDVTGNVSFNDTEYATNNNNKITNDTTNNIATANNDNFEDANLNDNNIIQESDNTNDIYVIRDRVIHNFNNNSSSFSWHLNCYDNREDLQDSGDNINSDNVCYQGDNYYSHYDNDNNSADEDENNESEDNADYKHPLNSDNYTDLLNSQKCTKKAESKAMLRNIRQHPDIKYFTNMYPSNNWKIIKNPKNNKHFILADLKLGVLNFFNFKDVFYQFELIETISFHNNQIRSCYFLPTSGNKLFISTVVASRMVHYFVEWERNSPKQVYKLKHLATYNVRNSIPIGLDNILLCSDNKSLLITTKQIICGDTNYVEYDNNIIQGIRSWFDDPIITKKLINIINKKNVLPTPLNNDDQCTIVLTGTSVLYAIFVSGIDKKLYNFSLGRFKQLRSIYSDKQQNDAKNDSHMIIALIFNRTVRLELDLHNIELVPVSSKRFTNRKLTEDRTTISSNSDENNNTITHVTSKNEVILSGSSSITQLSGSSVIPIRESKTIGRFKKSFRNYNCIKIVNKIDKNKEKNLYLNATRNKEVSNYFKFNNVEQIFEAQSDIEHEADCLFTKNYDTHILKVTKHEVICIQDKSRTTLFSSDFPIDGMCSLYDKMILWNLSHKKIWFFYNTDSINQIKWKANEEFHDIIKHETEFSFFLYYNRFTPKLINIVVFTPKYLIVQYWQNDPIQNWIDKVNNNQRIIYTGKFNSFTVLQNGLFCVKTYKEMFSCLLYGNDLRSGKATMIDHELLNCNEFDIDLIIKPLHANYGIAIICPDNLYLITCNERISFTDKPIQDTYSYDYWNHHIISLEEVKLPTIDSYKKSYLLDVEIYESGKKKIMCLLYDTGLQCIETLYLTWNKYTYLLQNTRSKNKLFTNLENLNRILVTNCDTNEWYLLNIRTGKIKILNNEVLNVSDGKIRNVLQYPISDDSNNINKTKYCSLLVMFDTMIKHIKLNVIKNDTKVIEMCKHSFNGFLHREYSIYANTVTLLEREIDKEIFHKIRVNANDGSIEFLHQFSLKMKSPTKHFITGLNYIVLSGESENRPLFVIIYHIYNVSGALTEKFLLDNTLIENLKYPSIYKLLKIANDMLLVIYEDDEDNDVRSKLDIIKLTDNIMHRSKKEQRKLFYSDVLKSYDDPDVVCFWSYMVNSWYLYITSFCGEDSAKRSYLYTDHIQLPLFGYGPHFKRTSISLDKKVLDAKYVNNRLFVLCHDQTVLQFGPNEDLFDSKRGVLTIEQNNKDESPFTKNYGYVSPDSDLDVNNIEILYSNMDFSSIDPWGRLILRHEP
ncbi:Mms1p PWA37_004494 [Arxiozyma heterogenica]|uniref:Mms1p n=1 Tax=Arxiozyma heterogenica TaxID=278026 RepID=UPI002EF5614F